MAEKTPDVIKSTGEKVKFSIRKLRTSLRKSGAGPKTVDDIIEKIRKELYQGISTAELYNRAYALLREEQGHYASRYRLKQALYDLGPTGFPFERFVAAIMEKSGFSVAVGQIVAGNCVSHEVDVLAEKDRVMVVVECKYHADPGKKCNVKVPLYIHSRYRDIALKWNGQAKKHPLAQAWVVTNTRFTTDAIEYGKCAGLYLLSWDYPKKEALKDRIDRFGLYPLTVTDQLSASEKEYLLSRDVVLLRELIKSSYLLDHLGISRERKHRILSEVKALCHE